MDERALYDDLRDNVIRSHLRFEQVRTVSRPVHNTMPVTEPVREEPRSFEVTAPHATRRFGLDTDKRSARPLQYEARRSGCPPKQTRSR